MTVALRIGYLVPKFPGRNHMPFWREINAIESMGHEVHLLSTRRPSIETGSCQWAEKAISQTHYLNGFSPSRLAEGLAKFRLSGVPSGILREGAVFARDVMFSMSAASDLADYSQRFELDHIHVHTATKSALIAALARQMGGARYSLSLHRPLDESGPGQVAKWQNASFATTVSKRLRDEVELTLSGKLPPRVIVQPIGIDVDLFKRIAPYKAVEKGRPLRIFSNGRLSAAKGHQDMVTAIRLLLDDGVDVRLEIAGEDAAGGKGFRKEIEAQIKKLHLLDHVKLLGGLDSSQIRAKLMDAHVFALAPWAEPLGVAYIEAMACGVPVIATEAGGVPELIDSPKVGRLVPPRSPQDLARAVRNLSQDPEACLALSQAGRTRIETVYTVEQGASALIDEIIRTKTAAHACLQPD